MIRRPPKSTLDRSSAASDVYKRQLENVAMPLLIRGDAPGAAAGRARALLLSLIHISEPT